MEVTILRIVLRCKKWKRPVSFSLSDKYAEFLEKQPNRSEYLRNLLDKAMEEEKIKKEIETAEKKLDLEGYILSEDEVRLIAERKVENYEDYLRYDRETIRDLHCDLDDWREMFRDENRLDLWQKFANAVKSKFSQLEINPEGTFFYKDLPDEAQNDVYNLLEPIEKVVDVLWKEKWRERYNKIIVEDLTLGQIYRRIDENAERRWGTIKPMSIRELAQILRLTYQQVYRILPLMEEEFGTLIDQRRKEA